MERVSPYLGARVARRISQGLSDTREVIRRLVYQKYGIGLKGKPGPKSPKAIDAALGQQYKVRMEEVEEKRGGRLGGFNDPSAGIADHHDHAGQES